MAQVDIGKIKIVWKGPWNSGTAYTVDDAVSHSGSSYICIQAGTNQNPSSATAYWQQMSAKGTDADLINIASTAQGDIYYNNGSAIARLGAGTSGQFLKTQGTGANPVWADNTAGWIKHTYFENNTRTSHSDSNHRVIYSIAFTKSVASSIIIVQGIIPVSQENSDNVGQYGAMDTGGSEPANDSAAHTGVLYIPTENGSHPGGFIYNQRYTGLSAGSHTFYAGYNPRDGGGNQPGILNYNSSENGRNQQSGSTFIIQEVSA